ncbi:MAG: hypothetical protein AB7I30_06880 [Isosphaeraceae bacterium]
MRRPLLGWVAALAVVACAPTDRAFGQLGGVTSDPFSFYYGYYLPHQQAMAAQPRATDTINQIVARRQYTAQTDRTSLYDPISPYASDEMDQFDPRGADRRAMSGGVRRQSFSYGGGDPGNLSGNGPASHYKRTERYFPTLRDGRGPNMNLSAVRPGASRAFGSMPNMPSMPSAPGIPR